jgi:aspartate carbamoyltransferase regulatory subunit
MDDDVRKVKGIEPERIGKYYVRVDGKEYLIKQVVALALNVPKISFTSMDAYRILEKLGFKVYVR